MKYYTENEVKGLLEAQKVICIKHVPYLAIKEGRTTAMQVAKGIQNCHLANIDLLGTDAPKIEISEADKDQIEGEFAKAERALLRLEPTGEDLGATEVYEVLQFLRDKCLGVIS